MMGLDWLVHTLIKTKDKDEQKHLLTQRSVKLFMLFLNQQLWVGYSNRSRISWFVSSNRELSDILRERQRQRERQMCGCFPDCLVTIV